MTLLVAALAPRGATTSAKAVGRARGSRDGAQALVDNFGRPLGEAWGRYLGDDHVLLVASGGGLVIADRDLRNANALDAPGLPTLLLSGSFCFEVSESGDTVRLDFRPRTLRERVALWRRKWGL